jgi:5'-phosphate synthase pdxT subunit
VSAPTVGVLALQGAFREHLNIFDSLGVNTRGVRTSADLAGLDALAIPGGESTTMSRLAADLGVLEPVANVVRSGLPTLGTCAGMIMLADEVIDGRSDQQSFGGLQIAVRRNAFGRQSESFEAQVSMPVLGEPAFPGVFIRAPWVEQASESVEVWGQVERPEGSRIVAVRQGPVVATAFHPELADDDRVHRKFLSLI